MEQTFGIAKKKETKTHYERLLSNYMEQEAQNIEFSKIAYKRSKSAIADSASQMNTSQNKDKDDGSD